MANKSMDSGRINNERNAGVSRGTRISDEGLQRLIKQLQSGARMSDRVLQQWIKRYGDDARVIIVKHRPDFKDEG